MMRNALRKSAKQYAKQERFTIVCAWCNRVQHGREWRAEHGQLNGPMVSHGICPDCYRLQLDRLAARTK